MVRDSKAGLMNFKMLKFLKLNAFSMYEGVFVEPASAASIGGAIRDIKAGKIAEGSVIVCTVTGNGLKDPDTAIKQCADAVMLSIDATWPK